ncbi:MAG: redoxin family protein [Candidatus Hydrogenedentes bacterium]|nr:redoxin family protein [Candidatus Hydrogenedentota bacterium]
MKFHLMRPLLLTIILLSVHPDSRAAEPDGTAIPDPSERLLAASTFLSEHPAFTVDIDMALKIEKEDGASDGIELTAALAFAGDKQARFRVDTPDGPMELYASDEQSFLYLSKENQYVDGAVLGSREKSLTAMPGGPFRSAQFLLSDMLHTAPAFQKTLKNATVEQWDTLPLAGSDQIHLGGIGVASDFWIQQDGAPLLQKFLLDLTELAVQSDPDIKLVTVAYTFKNWNLEPEFAADHFTFKIPEGATAYTPQQPTRPTDPMVGNPAPNINAPILTGGTLDLGSHKGKNVVIIDFWASWCGPCRIGLPIVTRVADRYKDKGVVLYAVNIGEDEATAQAFVEQSGLTATVALDTKRVAQEAYGANSIPRTIIIDKEGIVREVHAGVSPTLEQDLDKLLAELTE